MSRKGFWKNIKHAIPEDHSRQVNSTYYVEEVLGTFSRPVRVLDVGAGTGRSFDVFKSKAKGLDWVGLDIESSPEVAKRTRTDINFVTYDGANIPFEANEFDIVYSNQVLEHVRHPETLLQEVARVLKPTGYFIGSTSQLEPYHSFSLWNFTIYGFYTIASAAGLLVEELRPGIDGASLMMRSFTNRLPMFSKWFVNESPLNQMIADMSKQSKLSHKQINNRKLMYCGHFCFKCRKMT